jgi:hypothetical protein
LDKKPSAVYSQELAKKYGKNYCPALAEIEAKDFLSQEKKDEARDLILSGELPIAHLVQTA